MPDDNLMINPYLKIELYPQSPAPQALVVQAPIRGRGLNIHSMTKQAGERLFRLVEAVAHSMLGEDSMLGLDLKIEELSVLREIGVIVQGDQVSHEVRFACFADAQTSELFPRVAHQRTKPSPDSQELTTSAGNWWFERQFRVPASLAVRAGLCDSFGPDMPLLWVEDRDTRIIYPWWLHPPLAAQLEILSAEGNISQLDHPGQVALANAGVLVNPAAARSRSTRVRNMIAKAADQFEREGYAILRDLIHPSYLASMRSYYRELVAEGYLHLGDTQCLRYTAHNESVARFFQHQLTRLVSAVAIERLIPSYCYFSCYQPGAVLSPHTDREQCKVTMSLLIDYVPEPEDLAPWPLYLETKGSASLRRPVSLAIGDAVVYKGCELKHSRDRLPDSETSTSLLFHYVNEGFMGALD